MSGIMAYRLRLANLLKEKAYLEARIAILAKIEDEVDEILGEAIAKHGGDFDQWLRTDADQDTLDELRYLLDRLVGHKLAKGDFQVALEGRWDSVSEDAWLAQQDRQDVAVEARLRREDVA